MIFSKITPFNADLYTPIELYLLLRDKHRKTCLLESNDYHDRSNSKSFLGLNPIIEILLENHRLIVRTDGNEEITLLSKNKTIGDQIQAFLDSFIFENPSISGNGFFGRIGFEFSYLTEDFINKLPSSHELPDVHLFLYETIIIIDHFSDNGHVITNGFDKEMVEQQNIDHLFKKQGITDLPFELVGEETSDLTDLEFSKMVQKGIDHCKRGDVFQLVVSNEFRQSFFGDDFNIYRQLRRLNPSPYLFYFDFESYRLMGSSPEAQVVIENGNVEIHPIAGTVPKSGDSAIDNDKITFLLEDEKENAEHTMLVDLARNDLSKDCSPVRVEVYKEVQHFSHVIHLVSKVVGKLKEGRGAFSVFNNSFPAGTLSGTPKPKALELINKYEKTTRDFYGGGIGIFGSNGNVNLAIVIRSILSQNNVLHYRAGAGVVLDSIIENEVNEVHHKLKAVKTAIEMANKMEY